MSEKLRSQLKDPFAFVPDLEPDERKALVMLARGGTIKDVVKRLKVHRRTAYRIVSRGLDKLNAALGEPVGMDGLTALAFRLLEETAGLEEG
jgi:hypothetical protein